MMVYPFCYVCPRDWKMFEMLVRSLEKTGRSCKWTAYHDRREPLTEIQLDFCERLDVRVVQRPDDFYPWCGWKHAMSKLYGWTEMASHYGMSDDDHILYCDSDTMFFSDEILAQFEGYDFIGFPHSDTKYVEQLRREWSWLSGCFQAARVGMVRKLAQFTATQLYDASQEMLANNFSHNEDVVMSYLFAKCGAKENRLKNNHWMEMEPEKALRREKSPASFVHLNGNWKYFLGEPVEDKWDIPRVIDMKGLMP